MNGWQRPVALIVAVTVVVEILMALTGMGPRPLLVGALGVALGSGTWLTLDLAARIASEVPSRARTSTPPAFTDVRGASLRNRIISARRDSVTADRLYATLVELIDDELTAAHGIDRDDDPVTAEAVLGPDLSRFVADPRSARSLSRPHDLAHVLTLIERIRPEGK